MSVLLSCQHDTNWREAESILWATRQRAPLLKSFFQIFVSHEFVRKAEMPKVLRYFCQSFEIID